MTYFSLMLNLSTRIKKETHTVFFLQPRTYDTDIVSEYDQEIPQSLTENKPMAPRRKSHTTITRHQEDKLSKATSFLFPINMIAKLEWT